MRFPARLLLLITMFACLVSFSPGCATEDEVKARRAAAVDQKQQIDESVSKAQTQVATAKADQDKLKTSASDAAVAAARMPDGPDKVKAEAAVQAAFDKVQALGSSIADMQKAIDSGTAASSKLGDQVRRADAILADIDKPSAAVGVASSIATAFNPIAGVLVSLLGGLGYKSFRLSQANAALKDTNSRLATGAIGIVKSVESMAGYAPEIAATLQKYGDTIGVLQGGVGKKIVDAVQEGHGVAGVIAAASAPASPAVV